MVSPGPRPYLRDSTRGYCRNQVSQKRPRYKMKLKLDGDVMGKSCTEIEEVMGDGFNVKNNLDYVPILTEETV